MLFVRFYFVGLHHEFNHREMKRISVVTTDERELHFIPENRIIEVGEEPDGTSTIAFVCVINVKQPADEIRKELSKSQVSRIKWLKLEKQK